VSAGGRLHVRRKAGHASSAGAVQLLVEIGAARTGAVSEILQAIAVVCGGATLPIVVKPAAGPDRKRVLVALRRRPRGRRSTCTTHRRIRHRATAKTQGTHVGPCVGRPAYAMSVRIHVRILAIRDFCSTGKANRRMVAV
jgi:hypothetical protein